MALQSLPGHEGVKIDYHNEEAEEEKKCLFSDVFVGRAALHIAVKQCIHKLRLATIVVGSFKFSQGSIRGTTRTVADVRNRHLDAPLAPGLVLLTALLVAGVSVYQRCAGCHELGAVGTEPELHQACFHCG